MRRKTIFAETHMSVEGLKKMRKTPLKGWWREAENDEGNVRQKAKEDEREAKVGSVGSATLKAKKVHNYRKGFLDHTCSHCGNYKPNVEITGIGGVKLGIQNRCTVMGLGASRRYKINPTYLCDKHTQKGAGELK